METTIRIPNLTDHLAKATGYSKSYCIKVLKSDRSDESKGGKIIMAKYQELLQVLDHYYTNDVCVAETTEEMNELLTQKIESDDNSN
jgi:hypothetical protein